MAAKFSAKTKKKIAIGAGAGLAVASVATGAYYLFGAKGAASRRKKLKSWGKRARAEVVKQIRSLPNINESTYDAVIDRVFKKYKGLRNVDPAEAVAMIQELKGHWSKLTKQLKGVAAKRSKPSRKKSSR